MNTTKRIISLLMCMLMVLSIVPMSVFAGDTVDVTQMYIHNGAGEITALGKADLASDIDRISTDGWKWDSVNRQLLLSGFNGKYIEADGDLTIVLTGENTITMYDTGVRYEDIYGIRSTEGEIVIKGDGEGGRDSLFVGQTAVKNVEAYYTAIEPGEYTYDTYITDCDVKIALAGENPEDDRQISSYAGIHSNVHVTGDANLDIDVSASSGNGGDGVYCLYAETSGTIDINVYDADKTDAYEPYRGSYCTGGLYATGTGTVNLNADGKAYVNRWVLVVGENAGTITAKGKLELGSSNDVYIRYGSYYNIAPNKAITSLDGTKQYCIGYNYNEERYILEDSNETVAKEWKIATVENNPLVFFDLPSLDQEASYIEDSWDYEDLQGLVFGGSGEYTYTATGCPEGIYMSSYDSDGLTIARIVGDFKAACEAGTITVTVTDSLGATASIDVAYGAITELPKYVTVDGNKFNAKENKSGTGWAYTAADKTLALNNYDGGPIISEDELTTIILTGNNTVTMPAAAGDFENIYGIDSGEGGMTIKGDGTGGRDTLTVTQTAIENIDAYYTAIEPGEYNNHMYITDCDVKVELAGADPSSEWKAENRDAISAYLHVTGNANLDIDVSASKDSYTTGPDWLYAETSGTIDINLYDADKTDEYVLDDSSRCVDGLTATGTGTVNLNVDGDGYAIYYILTVGENAGTITAKGTLGLGSSNGGYIANGYYYNIAPNKAITSPDGSKQYCIAYIEDFDEYMLADSNGNVITEWKIATVPNNPLVFFDMPYLDQGAGITGDSWDYECLHNLVFGGSGKYTYTATGCPEGIYMSSYDSYGLTIARLVGDFETISEGGTITVTVTDSLGATASIDVAYGAIAPKTPVTGISLDKDEIILNVGEEYKLKPTLSPEDVTVAAVSWGTDDDYIARVNDNGVVTGKGAGVATITATTVQGGFKDTCKVYVKEEKPEAQQDGEYIYDLDSNTEYRINGTAYTTDGNGRIPIDDSWLQAYVSIVKTNAEEKCYSDPQTLIIGGKKIRSEWITLEYYNTFYDGTEKCPAVTVKDGDTLLTEGNDYTLTYKGNTDAGSAYAVITGIGGYTGVVEKEFYIDGKTIYNADVTLSPDTFDYDGNAKTPAVTVVIDGTTLVEGTDYTLEFYDNIKSGTASVKVAGKGSYAGSKIFYFTIKPCTHTWDSGVIKKDSTCAAEGEKLYTCTVKDCGETKTEVIEKKTEHTWNTGVHTTPPTCTEEGEITYTCKITGCGATKTAVAPSNGHSWLDATCTAPKTCKICGATEGTVGGHKWVGANCTTPKTCSVCGETEGSANGHSWNDATCTTPKKCSVCGETEGTANGHTWLDATCTAPKTCKVCGATSGKENGHSWLDATCTAPKTCSSCGETEGKANGHKFDNDCDTTCNNCTYTRTTSHKGGTATCTTKAKCSVCGKAYGSLKAHSYKTVTTKATTSKNGKTESKCSCGAVKSGSTKTVYYPKTIKLEYTSATYNGKTKTPSVSVKDYKGNKLKKDTDYTVKYASGRKSTGKYSVTITFKGKYSGTKTLYFNILPSKTSKITPTCSTTEIKASWSKVTGASGYKVELLNSKGKVVKKVTTTKTSYTFKKLSKVTTYKIRVTAYKTIDKKAAYSTVSTTITTSTAPAKVSLSKVTAGSKAATPAWKTVSGASGYQVQYSTSSKFKSAKTATVSKGSSKKTTIKKLTKGKKYYFKVRAYKTVGSVKVYGAWSAVKSVKVK